MAPDSPSLQLACQVSAHSWPFWMRGLGADGAEVRGGLHGPAPNLSQLVDGNLSMQVIHGLDGVVGWEKYEDFFNCGLVIKFSIILFHDLDCCLMILA